MSIFLTVRATCPDCGATADAQLAASVNADRRPDLREAIGDGSFQAMTCAQCGGAMRLPAHLSYLDIGRGHWILAEATERVAAWREAEEAALGLFDQTYGSAAPAVARELGAGLAPRIVFGWPALREKIVCRGLGLDDVTLELLKIAVLRSVPGPPLADETELRLRAGEDDTLHLAWLVTATEAEVASLPVPRTAYDGVAGDGAWATLRAEFVGRAFVDMQRLLR